MVRRLYMLAEEQNVASLLELARVVMENDECHFFLRYNWHNSDFAKEVNFSKSFACLVDTVRNCGFMNLANVFKNCHFDAESSCETGFITFKTNDNSMVFSFAFIRSESKNQNQNLLRISGRVEKSVAASDNDLLGYLLSLGI